jgi:C-terminal processing protease CtpA/Prc
VNMSLLMKNQLDEIYKKLVNTKGIIFDLRGYPNNTGYWLAASILDKPQYVVKYEIPLINAPRQWSSKAQSFTESFVESGLQEIEPQKKWDYKGKVLVLINEKAQSAAEHTCLFFKETMKAKVMGTPSVGADGNVTKFTIPGGLTLFFTGIKVIQINGRQLQRKGIIPDIIVKPTILGVQLRRDEVLEEAIKYISK